MTSNKLTLFTFLVSRYFPGHKKDKKLIRLRAAPGTKKWILMSKICLLFPQWLWRWGRKRAFSRSTSKAREKCPGDEFVKRIPRSTLLGIKCKEQQTEYGAGCNMCKIYRTDPTSENNKKETKSAQLIVLHLDS